MCNEERRNDAQSRSEPGSRTPSCSHGRTSGDSGPTAARLAHQHETHEPQAARAVAKMGNTTNSCLVISDLSWINELGNTTNLDVTCPRHGDYLWHTPIVVPALSRFLRNQRDVAEICFYLNILQIVGTSFVAVCCVFACLESFKCSLWAALQYFCAHVAGCMHVALVGKFTTRFYIHHHNFSHRRTFRNKLIDDVCLWVMGSFFGLYALKEHHVAMHHHDDNCEPDISSTDEYNRASWKDFRRYQIRFLFAIDISLWYYISRFNPRWLGRLLLNTLAWYFLVLVVVRHVSPCAAFYVLIAPRFLMLRELCFANWAEHIFVDATGAIPRDDSRSAYNCINSPVNHDFQNVGYHLCHHMNPLLPWSDLPQFFLSHLTKLSQLKALTFGFISSTEVALLVMNDDLDEVCRHYVHLGPVETRPSFHEVRNMLEKRLLPCSKQLRVR